MKLTVRSFVNRVDELLSRCQQIVVFAASIAIAGLMCAIVLLRYVFRTDLHGMEEIVVFVGIWLFFIGASLASHRQEHITADVVPQFLAHPVLRNAVVLFTTLVSFVVAALAAWWAWQWLLWGFQRPAYSTVHGIPMTVTHLAVFTGFVLMGLFTLRDTASQLRALLASLKAVRQHEER